MSRLFIPPRVAHELEQETQRRQTSALGVLERAAVCKEFDPDLQRIDPDLSMVFCPEITPQDRAKGGPILDAVAAGARPGRYNVMRQAPGAPWTFKPITGPNGEFVEPTSRVFEMLKEQDWWDPAVRHVREQREQRLEDARRRREENERRERDEVAWEHWQAVSRTQVSMNRSTPWSQNHAGQRAAKGAARRRDG